jgi:hypothetical protein
VSLNRRILDWSTTRPPWQSDLLRRLCEGPLTAEARDEVLAILLAQAGAPAPRPLTLDDLPADAGEHGQVGLRRIGDLRNVNCIAEGEQLEFEPGLNVVFGGTGAGKSGYGRLLKRVCRAAAPSEVLRDVFDPGASDKPQTAHIVLKASGKEMPVEVDLDDAPSRLLSAISVFDASCADFYLSKPSVIDWSGAIGS